MARVPQNRPAGALGAVAVLREAAQSRDRNRATRFRFLIPSTFGVDVMEDAIRKAGVERAAIGLEAGAGVDRL